MPKIVIAVCLIALLLISGGALAGPPPVNGQETVTSFDIEKVGEGLYYIHFLSNDCHIILTNVSAADTVLLSQALARKRFVRFSWTNLVLKGSAPSERHAVPAKYSFVICQ